MFGTDNLKNAVRFAVSLIKQVETSGKDGWNWKDSFSFIDELMSIPGLIASGDEIAAEFKDLSELERLELEAFFKEEFNIENDKTEAVVENAVGVVLKVLSLVSLLKPLEVVVVTTEEPPLSGEVTQ